MWNDYREALFHGDHTQHKHVGDRVVNISGGGSSGDFQSYQQSRQGNVPVEQQPGGGTQPSYGIDPRTGKPIDPPPPGATIGAGTPTTAYGPDPNVPGRIVQYNWDGYRWAPSYGFADPNAAAGPAGPTGDYTLEQLLALPGVTGHEVNGPETFLYTDTGRVYAFTDVDGDGYMDNAGEFNGQPGPNFVPLGGTAGQENTTAPGLGQMTDRLFSPSSTGGALEGRLDYFSGTPDTPKTEGEAYSDVLRANNPNLTRSGTTYGQRDPFGNYSQVSADQFANTLLQGQTPQMARSRDQQVLDAYGISSNTGAYSDPLQARALTQQLNELQRKYQAELGLDPIAARNMVMATYGGQQQSRGSQGLLPEGATPRLQSAEDPFQRILYAQ